MAVAIKGSADVVECLRVLQKPSAKEMYEKGAVFSRKFADDGSSSTSLVCIDEAGDSTDHLVYTDSVFWFDTKTRDILLTLYEDLAPLDVEIDAYGDFLQAMGTTRFDLDLI